MALSTLRSLTQRTCHRLNSHRALSRAFSNGTTEQVTAILGAQWGDEGKGKLVDILSASYSVCCRFNGGSNAGHTLGVDGQKLALHLLPCGVLTPECRNVIGNGVVAHVPTLMHELQSLLDMDVRIDGGRILLSDRAHIVFDFHQEMDGLLETLKDKQAEGGEGGSIGTTRRGIGPAYASKCFRNGLRFGDLRDWASFKQHYLRLVEMNQLLFDGLADYNAKEELQRFEAYRELLLPMIADTVLFVNNEYQSGKRILMEGQFETRHVRNLEIAV